MLGKRCECSQTTIFTGPYAQIKYKIGSNQTSKTTLFQDLKSCDLTVVRVQVPPRVLWFSIAFFYSPYQTKCDLSFICNGVTRSVEGVLPLAKIGSKTEIESTFRSFPSATRILANRVSALCP